MACPTPPSVVCIEPTHWQRSYVSPAYWDFTSASDRLRIEAFISKSKKLKLYANSDPNFEALCKSVDDSLFHKIISNHDHSLHYLLPPHTSHPYNLRLRRHNLQLPTISSAPFHQKNFLSRLLIKDSY